MRAKLKSYLVGNKIVLYVGIPFSSGISGLACTALVRLGPESQGSSQIGLGERGARRGVQHKELSKQELVVSVGLQVASTQVPHIWRS